MYVYISVYVWYYNCVTSAHIYFLLGLVLLNGHGRRGNEVRLHEMTNCSVLLANFNTVYKY